LIVSSITASLAGGTGIALVASGPIGWVVGALLGLVAAILAIRYGTKRGTEMAKTWSVPAWAARRLMSPARIQRLRRETRRGFRKQVGAVVRAEKTGILGATSKLIHDEIGALSVFQALGNPQR
jgi:hypothetical protein